MTARLALAAVSYDTEGAATATGLSPSRIKEAQRSGELIAHYSGTKPVFLAADLVEWIEALPTESPRRSA